MTEYTPTTEDIRDVYSSHHATFSAEFDRWLVEHDRQVAEQAWDEGLEAGQDRWMDAREFGDPPVNPYRTKGTEQ